MPAPQRNQLVWLTGAAWQQLLARNWDAQAQTILQHWHAQQLPLVVCSQRVNNSPTTLSLGLPAPTVWGRRKLALDVPLHQVARVGEFPALALLAQHYFKGRDMESLLAQLHALQVPVQVYGSFGWQWLTGLDYVRPASDLDLRAKVANHATARAVSLALQGAKLPQRVDGELAFHDGSAIAWREYMQWLDGRVDRVLVKGRTAMQLLDPCLLQDRKVPCIA